jgi:hypothetical protein
MIVRRPSSSVLTLPDTGASSMRAPTTATCSRALGHGLEGARVRHHAEDDVSRLRNLARRLHPDQPELDEGRRLLGRAVVARNGMAGSEQAPGDAAAHDPEPDEAEVRHA